MKQAAVPFRGIWSDRPALDWLAVLVLLLGYWLAYDREWLTFGLWELATEDRMRVYVAIATVSSLLFGFATASIAFFYGSAKGGRIELLKKVLNEQIVRTWRAALSAPLIAVAAALVAMVADTATTGRVWVGVMISATLAFLALRAFRLRWMFVITLGVMTADLQNPSETVSTSTGQPPTAKARPRPRDRAGQQA